jgi:hypothetical protein
MRFAMIEWQMDGAISNIYPAPVKLSSSDKAPYNKLQERQDLYFGVMS